MGRVGRVGQGRGGRRVGFMQEDVWSIWTCWQVSGYYSGNSGKSTLPFWTSISLSVKWPALSRRPKNQCVSAAFG